MRAKHGNAGRGRLIGCLTALVVLSAVVFAPAASAAKPETTYLALGDSLAFGYTQEKFEVNFPNEPTSLYEAGYAHFFAKKLRSSSVKFAENLTGLVEVNNGCPGETTDSLIGNGPLGAHLDPTGTSPCGYHSQLGFPLHHEYGAGQSQLENALQVIAEHPTSTKAITLNIGSNDELAAVHKCETEVREEYEAEGKSKYGATPTEAVSSCTGSHAKELFEHIIHNIGSTVYAIDHGASFGGVNYTGPIVLMGFYNPQSFLLPGSDALQKALNENIEAAFFNPASPYYVPNMTYGNPFPKINVKKPANEKANIAKYTEMCNPFDQKRNEEKAGHALPECDGDIHPTLAGYELLSKVVFKAFNPAL